MLYNITKPFADSQMQKTALWVARMMEGAEATAKMIGCSPEAVVAQAALESGWGRAAIGNNVFGIKADGSWHGATLMRRTAEQNADGSVYFVDAPFRDYPTLADGILDHFQFLKCNSRYADAGVFDPDGTKTDRQYFEALKRAGYATDVAYVDKLMAMLSSVQIFTARMERSDTATAVADAKPGSRMLMVGMSGGDVVALQKALGIKPDGSFGPKTFEAVRLFQEHHGLVADSIVGAATRNALGEMT